jgi:myo-inositol-1(or 4)-monophosphatase
VNKELLTLKKALTEAGKIAKKYYGKVSYDLKGRGNLVTKADYECQKKITQIISKAFPTHAFLAEEKQQDLNTQGKYIWVIDPIDGTANYAHTFPHSGISVGLTKDAVPVLGGVLDFARGEMFYAVKGKGAFLNGKKIHVSKTAKLQDSLLVTGFPFERNKIEFLHIPVFKDFLMICHDVRRTGAASLDLCWTAAGRIDGYWEFTLNPWDVCAGKLILEEAGGKVSDFNGKPWNKLETYGAQTLASNGKIHKQMLSVLKKTVGEK